MSLTTRIESHFPASFFGGAASDRLRTFSARQRLSRREADVLGAALHGLSMKEAATVLSLSPKTVENYWSRIYAKTGQTSQLAVVARLWMSDVMPIQDI